MSISSDQVGTFIDSIAGTSRTVQGVVGRLLEEAVELALAAGLSSGEIFAHVADSLHNQCLKRSHKIGITIFPSEIVDNLSELPGEVVDVSLTLKDVMYLCKGVDFSKLEFNKWSEFIERDFAVSDKGTLYSKKPHIRRVSDE